MRVAISVLLLLLLIPAWMGAPGIIRLGRTPHVAVRRVPLDPTHPARSRVGDLLWLGGIELRDPDPAFGGFSALAVDGERVTLLSDSGDVVRFRLDPRWRVHNARFATLPAGPGRGWSKEDRDSESLGIDRRRGPHRGALWVGFENANALWRYDATLTRATGHVAPPAMRRWPRNEGPEAMTLLPGGGLVTIAETRPWAGRTGRAGIVFSGDPIRDPRRGFRFDYLPPPGYDPSDMTVLPDGRWLILDRRFDYAHLRFGGTLSIVDPARVRPGATVSGRVIAVLETPLIHENWEGVAATREGTTTIIWLVSDDNQAWPLQRSYLVKFRLGPLPDGGRR